MLTVQHVRENYKEEYWDLSDIQVQEVLDFFYAFSYVMVDNLLYQKGTKKRQ